MAIRGDGEHVEDSRVVHCEMTSVNEAAVDDVEDSAGEVVSGFFVAVVRRSSRRITNLDEDVVGFADFVESVERNGDDGIVGGKIVNNNNIFVVGGGGGSS